MTPRRKPERTNSRRTRHRAAVAAVFVAFASATVGISLLVTENFDRAAETRMQRSTEQATAAVQNQLATYFEKLQDTGAFLAAHPDASRAEFSTYVRSSGIFQDLPWLDGVMYVEKVDLGGLDAFAEHRQAIDDTFGVIQFGTPPPGSPHYILTQYEPGRSKLPLPMGFDASVFSVTRHLAQLTEETKHGVATSIKDDPSVVAAVRSLTDDGSLGFLAMDFFVGVPVLAPDPVTGIPDRFLGAIVAPVNAFDQLFAGVTQDVPEDLGLSLAINLRSSVPGAEDVPRFVERAGEAGPAEHARFIEDRTFSTDGVAWRLSVWAPPGFADGDLVRYAILAGGFVLALAGAALIHLRWRTVDELSVRAQLQHDIIDSVNDAMVVLDAQGAIVAANPAWSRLGFVPLTGSVDVDEGTVPYLLTMAGVVHHGVTELGAALSGVLAGSRGTQEVDILAGPDAEGHKRWFAVRATPLRGPQGGAVVVHTDVTGRKRTQQEFEFQASHDRLTGLLSRAALESCIDVALDEATERDRLGLLFVDLDGFKPINDAFGHAVGDEVLRIIAQRLRTVVRPGDQIGRIGGDEFVVVLAPLPHPDVALATAERLIYVVSQPLPVGERVLSLGASVGIAIAGPDDDRANLLHRADDAMYRAKRSGGGRFFTGVGT
jgi:diguanylate cyclase (GGDEF)-like protein